MKHKDDSYYQQRKAEGRCATCAKPAQPGRTRCRACAIDASRDALKRYYDRKGDRDDAGRD